ncbi:hypothetical protein NV226_03055 [Mycoplasma iguanae]|uniref:DUF31 domain-containing protein n=1 Tax=Mycoplasma iguanae TaxID=292461 RepID=A0ABY5R870_9MOLU|nr:hypothetical protein [Mycoplasma iguanae]UVD81678.1 hypothetical protein NV226_03055 [Mycoplasma iguanae]
MSSWKISQQDKDSVFNFNDDNEDMTPIKETFKEQKEFFINSINRSVYPRSVYQERRLWPSMSHGVAFKLNGIDSTDSRSRNKGYGFLLRGALSEESNKLNKIVFVSNQIWMSIFYNYKKYLDSNNTEQSEIYITNIYKLMQTFFHGTNAKKVFEEFLINNTHYNVSNFYSELTRENFASEPQYFQKLKSTDVEKTYDNLLMYLNYLNFNYPIGIINDSEFVITELSIDENHRGGFSSDREDSKSRYKSWTYLADYKKDEKERVADINFNLIF